MKLNNLKTNISSFFERMKTNRKVKFSIGIIFFIFMFILTSISFVPKKYDIKQGDIATEDILAPRKIVNTSMTESLRNEAEKQTPNVYDYIPNVSTTAEKNVNILFSIIKSVDPSTINDDTIKVYNDKTSIELSKNNYIQLHSLSNTTLSYMKTQVKQELASLYKNEVTSDKLNKSYTKIDSHFRSNYNLSETLRALSAKITKKSLKPNMVLNKDATYTAKKNAVNAVEEVVYEPGEIIVKKGDIISSNQISVLKDASMIKNNFFTDYKSMIGLSLMLIWLVCIYVLYLRIFHPEIYFDNKMLALLACQFLLMMAIAQISNMFNIYLIPVAFMTMTLCILVSSRIAIFTNMFFVTFISLALDLSVDTLIYLYLSGFIGIMYMQKIQQRDSLYKTAFIVSLTNAISIVVISIFRSSVNTFMFTNVLYGVSNGLFSAILTIGTLSFWEYLFSILTPFKLLELSNPTNDAMKKLISQAPGTYHHSLIVGNLAQKACDEIGGNSLLARIGAYYHDIGKTEKPLFFTENQPANSNPHDHLDPNVSARIIKNHVSDGVYLAEKYKIPKEIQLFIQTHHGDSLIKYFYFKEKERGIDPDKNIYSYDGPKPYTLETSVVALADSVEAAVKSMEEPSEKEIENMVNRIVDEKIENGQLLNSPLKMKDITTIKQAFISVLSGVYHERVRYPNQEQTHKEIEDEHNNKDIEKNKNEENDNKEVNEVNNE